MNTLVRQQLSEIIKQYGKDICSDSRRVKGLLNDLCGGNPLEINLLLTALDEQVCTELVRSSRTTPYEMLSARLIKRLCSNRGMAEEFARWAVDSWAIALGIIIIANAPDIKPQTVFTTPYSDNSRGVRNYNSTSLPPTIVVASLGGHYTTISEAIRNAPPGTSISIKPGHYKERLIIDRRIQLRGDGPREQIIIESTYASCIQVDTDDEALVQGLTLRCTTALANQKTHAVEISRGRLALIECDVTSTTGACIVVRGSSAYPTIRNCWLHNADGSGLLFEEYAQGFVEGCYIFSNSYPNVSIKNYAHPLVRTSKIYQGKGHGILVWEKGAGVIEDCDIFENGFSKANSQGVMVRQGGNPTIKGCSIYRNNKQDEWIFQNGMGNTQYPRHVEAAHPPQQNANPFIYQDVVRQQEVMPEPAKRPGLMYSFLRSMRLVKGDRG